jgi:transcription-repair coupling factor (superfamily II helicase)
MRLTGLIDSLRDSRRYQDQLSHIRSADTPVTLNVIRSARPFMLSALALDWDAPVIYLTARIKRAYNVGEQIPVWTGQQRSVLRFGEPASQFYEHAPWGEIAIRSRIEALAALMPPGDEPPQHQPIIIAAARGLMQRTLPVHQFRKASVLLKKGERIVLEKLLQQWLSIGYEAASIVVEPGTFSRRGGIIDIFPVVMDKPIRVELFDDEIESIRAFDPSTQRSAGTINQVAITPAREALPLHTPEIVEQLETWFKHLPPESEAVRDRDSLKNGVPFPFLEHYLPYLYPQPVHLLDYAPQDALIVIEDFDDLRDHMNELEATALKSRDEQIAAGRIPPDAPQPYIEWQTLEVALKERRVVQFSASGEEPQGLFTPGNRYGGQLKPVLSQVRSFARKGGRAVIVTEQTARLGELWREQDAYGIVPILNDLTQKPPAASTQLVTGTLQEGWTLHLENGDIQLITDAELFGWNRQEPRRRPVPRRARLPEADYADWREGDYVVHIDYGIGRFLGMQHRVIEGSERQYLVVEYAGNDTVFVPIHQADRLTRYVGVDENPPTLSKLGQQEWIRVRNRASKAIQEEAEELLQLYSERAKAQRPPFAPDNHWQQELEASFPYVETEDQIRAIREVKADLERSIPMDRLICGDVGYGKTEVALRAAFKAVLDGKQVAVLVPTTILAQQHYETFSNRLAAFPVVVEQMSRFRSKEEQEKILPRLANGEIDIIIGTHRILSADIQLHDLGLVIIDEEQRFGVKQKEHFKKLRTQVDVMTLTATPIPRTLYMSLAGVRDISMIQTPPEERLPVTTHVGVFDENMVRRAILRELERGGQIFVVHNRVRTLDQLRERLEDLVPEARIISAHGQMNERQLENVMSAFSRGEYDILLSTSIIESGIDIPNVNTLIVDRADMFGLSQLYQLRGRVGRSAQQAYAYLFYSKNRLTEEARARLETLAENTTLGSGYQIAMRDLEIRGAGDILSTRQTGHVEAIGLHLYTQLLSQAVEQLKGKKEGESLQPTIRASMVLDLPLPAYIPDDWISEISLRLQIYRRIANLTSVDEVEEMKQELQDRFGELPKAVSGLLYQIQVKLLAQLAGATAILGRQDVVQIKLPYLPDINREALAQALGDDIVVTRTAVEVPMDDLWEDRLCEILTRLASASKPVNIGGGV